MLEEEIVKKLLEKQYTVTTAESCTGGPLDAKKAPRTSWREGGNKQ